MAKSRTQIKLEMPPRWKTLAVKSKRRVDALLHAITIAQLGTDVDVKALRNVLIAELESARYHDARARGLEHREALDFSREGRKMADALAGWA